MGELTMPCMTRWEPCVSIIEDMWSVQCPVGALSLNNLDGSARSVNIKYSGNPELRPTMEW